MFSKKQGDACKNTTDLTAEKQAPDPWSHLGSLCSQLATMWPSLLTLSHTEVVTDGSQVRHLSAKGSLTPV